MTTLKKKLEYRNTALWVLYMAARPTTWLVAWCLIDFRRIQTFHLLTRNGERIMSMGFVETVQSFFRFSVWPYLLPLAVVWLVDVFIVSPWFKANVIRVKADGI